MFSSVRNLYMDMASRHKDMPSLPESLSMRQRVQAFEKIITHVAEEMHVRSCFPLRVKINETASTNPFAFASTIREIIIPTIYLLEKEEIPSSLLIQDENDPKLLDRGYYEKVRCFMQNILQSTGISTKSMNDQEVIESPVDLFTSLRMIRDNDSIARKNLEFVIRHEMAHIKLGHHLGQFFFQIVEDLLILFVFAALTICLPVPLILAIPTAIMTSILAEKALSSIGPVLKQTFLPSLSRSKEFDADKCAVKKRKDLIIGGTHRLNAKLQKQQMLCKLPHVHDVYRKKFKLNGSPIQSPHDTHPSEKKRIKALMKLSE